MRQQEKSKKADGGHVFRQIGFFFFFFFFVLQTKILQIFRPAARKTRCRCKARSFGHPPGPGDRGAIQPDLG